MSLATDLAASFEQQMAMATMIGIPLYRNIAINNVNIAKIQQLGNMAEGPDKDLFAAYVNGGQAAMGAFVQSQQQAEKSRLEKAGDKVSDLSNNPIVQGVAIGVGVLATGGLAASLLAPGGTGAAVLEGSAGQIGTNLGLESNLAGVVDTAGAAVDTALIPAKAIGTGLIFGGEAVAGGVGALTSGAAAATSGATAGIEAVVGGASSVLAPLAPALSATDALTGIIDGTKGQIADASSLLDSITGTKNPAEFLTDKLPIARRPEDMAGNMKDPTPALPASLRLDLSGLVDALKPAAPVAAQSPMMAYMPYVLAGAGVLGIGFLIILARK